MGVPSPITPPDEDERLIAALKPRPLDSLRRLRDAVLDVADAVREVLAGAVRALRRLLGGRHRPWSN